MIFMSCMQIKMNYIKESLIYKIIIKFINMLQKMVQNSYVYAIFTKEITNEKSNNSIFIKAIYKIIELIRKIIYGTKLDRVLNNSIFVNTKIWLILDIILLPFLSTTKILLLMGVTVMSFLLKIGLNKQFKFKYTPVNVPIILFLVVYVICAIISVDFKSSVKTAIAISLGIISVILLLNSIDTKKEIKNIIYCFCIVGLIVSLYGIYQYTSLKFFGSSTVDKQLFEDIKTRVTSSFDNPNVLGEYLLLVIPLTISVFFANKGIIKKIIIGIIVCVMGVCLTLTYSRGCYLGLLFSIGVFTILLNFKFIILFLVGLVAMPFVLPKTILNRFLSIGNVTDSSTKYRISIWKASIEIIKDYWYRPIGQGNIAFNKIYPLYSYNTANAEHSHCLFLQIMIETGLIGFIIFVVTIFKFFQYIFSGIKKCINLENKVYLIGSASGIAGFLVQSVFDNTLYNLRVGMIFWIFIGIGITYRNIIDKE